MNPLFLCHASAVSSLGILPTSITYTPICTRNDGAVASNAHHLRMLRPWCTRYGCTSAVKPCCMRHSSTGCSPGQHAARDRTYVERLSPGNGPGGRRRLIAPLRLIHQSLTNIANNMTKMTKMTNMTNLTNLTNVGHR